MHQPDNSGIIFPQDEYDDFVDMKTHTTEKVHLSKNTCAEDFKVEEQEGVLRVCSAAEDKEYTKEGLRIIAELRDKTTIIIEETCRKHKDPVERWSEARERTHHVMGDMLDGCFDELLEAETEVKNMIGNIIQFPKQQ